MSNLIHLDDKLNSQNRSYSHQRSRKNRQIFFTQDEFRAILATYSEQVANGQWRDYAIDCNQENAIFSIFRHSYEQAIFTIKKRKNGKSSEFSLNTQHRIVKRSPDLKIILSLLKEPIKLIKN